MLIRNNPLQAAVVELRDKRVAKSGDNKSKLPVGADVE